MKRLFTVVMTLLLGATMAFAQTGGDKKTTPGDKGLLNPQPLPPARHPETTTKTKSGKKGHKGGKKSKKGSSTTTTPPPK